ncbi:hypothetical protein ACH4LN_31660 [Streptomyces albus]|uniref:Uncharacterized protein n=1 Tax=Streptomyces albus TaxID=1888 RepID=A0A6C1CGN5_9ACTN|nr:MULTISPECIES: hypothetical protein [Streptomyces]EPD94799.1 hypothetical protein HMPREF1486_02613 [Streptomyces sp. HPH0547]MDI6412960.1 hypothetical protein [Streptomyces albus]QID40632.1 hypothetical protein G3260_004523 [Streptomyces albus]TGG75600.1 hypothetical protein D8771_31780 [Streptomyces albus]UVN55049.1 hypothetical protein NR995_11360 [Streptomyces albus]
MTSTSTGPGEPGTLETGAGEVPAPQPSVTAANDAIRNFVAGRTLWSKEALAELDRLRGQWQRAVRAEMVKAA